MGPIPPMTSLCMPAPTVRPALALARTHLKVSKLTERYRPARGAPPRPGILEVSKLTDG